MKITDDMRKTYSEVDEFIELLTEEEKNKIPKNLRQLFKEEKDKEYVKGIKSNIDIESQNLKNETLAVIALLNLNYWCEDENEKKRLKEVYANNEKKYQQLFQVEFNSDMVFNKSKEKNINISSSEEKSITLMGEFLRD